MHILPLFQPHLRAPASPNPSGSRARGDIISVALLFVPITCGHSRAASITQPPRIAWQEEEMPRIFQLLVPVPSLSAIPKNTHGKERCHPVIFK